MGNSNAETEAALARTGAEKRKHSRHQLIERLYIFRRDGTRESATSFEISVGGMSAATTAKLKIGDEVTLSPVAGEEVAARVRRVQGTMYGFEFRGVTDELREKLREQCTRLPLFRSSANI